MKFFAFIMALLVLALSCLPCADGPSFLKADKAKAELVKESHSQDDAPEDGCSPFCICSCCAGFSMYYSPVKMELALPLYRPVYTSLLTPPLHKVALPVWQPPQLG